MLDLLRAAGVEEPHPEEDEEDQHSHDDGDDDRFHDPLYPAAVAPKPQVSGSRRVSTSSRATSISLTFFACE